MHASPGESPLWRIADSVRLLVGGSSFRERQRGVALSIVDADSPHELSYLAAWRTVLPEKDTFVWSVLAAAQPRPRRAHFTTSSKLNEAKIHLRRDRA